MPPGEENEDKQDPAIEHLSAEIERRSQAISQLSVEIEVLEEARVVLTRSQRLSNIFLPKSSP